MKPNEQPTRTKLVQRVALGIVGVAILLLLYICFLLLFPTKVLDVESPMKVEPREVVAGQPGQVVTIKFKYCKYQDLNSQITIDYVGEAVIPSLATQRHFPVGCHTRDLPLSIPTSAPPGEYYLHVNITYQVNSLKEVGYDFDTETIKVK